MEGILGQVLATLVTTIIGMISVPLFGWLKRKSNQQKILNKTLIDDVVIDALRIGVENVANSTAQYYREAAADGKLTDEEKGRLQALAISEAQAVLASKGIELADVMHEEAVCAIIRHLVDDKAARLV